MSDNGIKRRFWQTRLETDEATRLLGGKIAKTIHPGDCIALRGDLGSGKTVLARGLIRNFCDNQDLSVSSPSYSLVQPYESPTGIPLWHFDLYRMKHRQEVFEAGFDDELNVGITLIEWPEILGDWLPPEHLNIELQILEHPIRLVTFEMPESWAQRLATVLPSAEFTETVYDPH